MASRYFTFVLLACSFLTPTEARAAKFVAGLTSLKINARAGESSTHPYQLTLDKSEAATRFRFRIEDWWRSEDGVQSFYAAPGTLERSCGAWVTLNPIEAVVQPGETLTTRLTMNVPADVSAGGHWCVLTVDEVPDPLTAPTGVGAQFVASVSTGIFVYIDPVNRAVDFVDLQIGGTEAWLKLRNAGNAPLGVEGQLQFFRVNELALTASVPFARITILPAPIPTGILRVSLPPASVLPPGRYTVYGAGRHRHRIGPLPRRRTRG
jgi:hypothetical protein